MSIHDDKLTTLKYSIGDKMSSMSVMEFPDWLQGEMDMRGLSQSDLARLSGVNRQVISTYVNRQRTKPDPEVLLAVARALRLPPETVFRAAGLLPQVSELNELKEQMLDLTANMSREEQREVLEYLRMKRRLREEREQEQQSLPLGEKSLKPRRAGSG